MRRLLFLLFPVLSVLSCYNSDDMPCATCDERNGSRILQNITQPSSSSRLSSSSAKSSSSSKISSSSSKVSSSSSSQPIIVLCKLSTGTCSEYSQDICELLGGSAVSSCISTRRVTIDVNNSSGDGWGYNYIRISVNGEKNYYVTLDGGYSDYYTFDFDVGDVIKIYWVGDSNSFPELCAFTVRYADNNRVLLNRAYGSLQSTSENEIQVGQFTVAAQ